MTYWIVEYIWIGGKNELRSKIRIIKKNVELIISDIPSWNFDGSSTNQASGNESEIILKPVRLFNNPLLTGYIILCDTYLPNGEPHDTNKRVWANDIFNKNLDYKPWFGLEQEYFLMPSGLEMPLGLEENKKRGQGDFYCSVGGKNAYGRIVAEEHLIACINANINISGINAEVAPGQWEFQIGPCEGIEQGDQLWMARYLLIKIAEKYNLDVNFDPKPVPGDWNGSGCHANISTLYMREGSLKHDGLYYIDDAIKKMSLKHNEHMDVYGSGNEQRMTGLHETASYDIFSDGIANRGCSIRRGTETVKNRKGYFEDRRPSSNCDPYLVTGKIFETIIS